MRATFGTIQNFFRPQRGWALEKEVQFKRQREIQALWIGIIAFCMPALLYYSNRISDCFRDTISHTYYTPFWGDVFVALTSFVGLFLLFYRGQSKAERWLAIIAGISAVTVALIPTTGSGCETSFTDSRIFLFSDADENVTSAFSPGPYFEEIHGIAAGILFLILTIFSLFVFTATDETNPDQRKVGNRNKKIRNIIYAVTGLIMVTCLALLAVNKFFGFPDCDIFNSNIGIQKPALHCEGGRFTYSAFWDVHNLTFYFEWLALAAFGVAWFVKGRGGGFLLLDENSDRILSKPWWLQKSKR